MTAQPAPNLAPEIESLLAFWSDAGVDAVVGDTPVNRRESLGAPATASSLAARRETRPGAASMTAAGHKLRAVDAASAPGEGWRQSQVRAQEAARAADNLQELASAIASFDGCPLKTSAKQAVFSRGDPQAPVMIVGEGPGAEEDAQGLPFVGRAGQLLDRMLNAAGLVDRVFITNTVFWRPPGNRTPTAEEQAVCAPFVERAVELVRPRLLLLVGGASAKFMLGKTEGILSLRGRWFPWRSADQSLEIPALATLHPAFLLRQPAAKRQAWSDVLVLAERLDRPEREPA